VTDAISVTATKSVPKRVTPSSTVNIVEKSTFLCGTWFGDVKGIIFSHAWTQ